MRLPKGYVEYCGQGFPEAMPPAMRELWWIGKGGEHKLKDGSVTGKGLEYHFKAAIKELWPEIDQHRWFNLFVEEWLSHTYVGVIGPKNSGKSLCASICHLVDYYAFPTCSTTLICSTTKERLEDRIWGEVKKFHRLARGRCQFIPGNLIEGRQRIVTDDRDEASEGRDFRNGLIGVACFLTGTLVDTPCGPRPIEAIRVGDTVYNAAGIGRVTQTHCRKAKSLFRVVLCDGRSVVCTSEHPFLTHRGWIKAIDLKTFDMVYSAHEAVRLLQESHRPRLSESEVLLCPVSRFGTRKTMQTVREMVPCLAAKKGMERQSLDGNFLQSSLCWNLGLATQGLQQEEDAPVCHLQQVDGWRAFPAALLFGAMPQLSRIDALRALRAIIHLDPRIATQGTHSFLQRILQEEIERQCDVSEACSSDSRRTGRLEIVPGFHLSFPSSDGIENPNWQGPLVSAGHRLSEDKTDSRDRWRHSLSPGQEAEGLKADGNIGTSWVDHIEIFQQRGSSKIGTHRAHYQVHNLSVSGHPSYSVNGIVVHNCLKGDKYVGISAFQGIKNKRVRLCGDELAALPKSFIDAIATMDIQGDIKVTGMGNPAQITDALGILCEPHVTLGGWDGGIDQTPKTKTWKTRFDNGVCIQLPGSDSPNMEAEPGHPPPFPYLMSREVLERDMQTWGRNDWHYLMFDEGRMPRGQGTNRVITRQLCLKHHALEEAQWLNSNLTYITCLDAAYRGVGGDRCVLMRLAFGPQASIEGDLGTQVMEAIINQKAEADRHKTILALLDTIIIPIEPKEFESPEDQIVMFVKAKHTAWNLGPENFFFDAGMRTSLVTAFARLWSPKVNSIDFGGKASERAVSRQIDVLCRDYYFNFVTELWYSVRLAIEAEQMRGLSDEVVQEGCLREWMMVGANKIQVETKKEMKLKSGRSPDLFDCLVTGMEGARQRGFVISRLGDVQEVERNDRWKQDLRAKAAAARRSYTLIHDV